MALDTPTNDIVMKTIITLGISLALAQVGCFEVDIEYTEISGKATLVTHFGTYVLDTGDDGKNTVSSDKDESWDTWCVDKKGIPKTELTAKSAEEKGFYWIKLVATNEFDRRNPEPLNVGVLVDDIWYYGVCDIKYTKLSESPLEFDFSTSACVLDKTNQTGATARIEAASFHVKTCPVPGTL